MPDPRLDRDGPISNHRWLSKENRWSCAKAAEEMLKEGIDREQTLFDAIAHGSPKHRAWLKQAIEDHFAGRPVQREATDKSGMKTFDIWMEGAVYNHVPIHAETCGQWPGRTFADACEAYVKASDLDIIHFDKSGPSYYDRRFFDEEMSARETFG